MTQPRDSNPPSTPATDVASTPVERATASTESATHCHAHEKPVFSCVLDGTDRIVSLCASATISGGLDARYAAGPLGKPDAVYPESGSGPAVFERTSLTYAGGTGGVAYSFESAGQVHVLYSVSGDDRMERQGELTTDTSMTTASADRACAPGTVVESDDMELLRALRSWPAQARIAKHGLPSPSP